MKLIIRWARWFGLARAVCIVLLFALVPLRVIDPRPLEEVRLRAFDLFQVLRPREQTARPVVIADIDEASLKEIGQWPWPRTVVADLVSKLNALGAVVVGFDVVFPEPDRMSPAVAPKASAASTRKRARSWLRCQATTRCWRKRSRRPAWSSVRPARRYLRRARRPIWRCRPASPSRVPIQRRS